MAGTNPVADYNLLDFTSMTASEYKAAIDANSVVAARIVSRFAPSAQASPNMTIRLGAGYLFNGISLSEVAGQNTGTITAPSVHSRIDRIVIDNTNGVCSIITGNEAVSPTPPAIPGGKSPVAQIALATSTTSITNNLITDERDFTAINIGGFGIQTNITSASTCNIGTVASRNCKVTGTTTITSFGTAATNLAPIFYLEFAASLTITHNGTSLICPGGVNLVTEAGGTGVAEYLGSGNWRIRDYSRADGSAINPFIGDSGSGGKIGLVPAPASGDASKFLSGAGTWEDPPGSVLVTEQVLTSTVTNSSGANVWADTGLEITVTPHSANSKFEIEAIVNIGGNGGGQGGIKILKNGSDVGVGGAAGSRTQVGGAVYLPGANHVSAVAASYLDSPNTTSNVTYKVQFTGNVSTTYVNRSHNDSNSADFYRSASSLIVREYT